MSVAANESAQELLRVHEELAREQEHNDLRAVMSTPQGRRFVWRLLEHAGLFGPSYASDHGATAYNEGRRSIAIGLLTRVQTEATDLYVTALTEQITQQRATADLRAAAAAEAVANPQENE